jgi:phosphoserine phosphatase RsbU/P
MIKTNSLSFRIISRVLVITTILFVIILLGFYQFTRNLIQESTRDYSIELAGNIAGRIEEVLQPMEKIPEMVAATLELGLLEPDSLFTVLQTIVRRNPDVYGACVAFEPYYFADRGEYFMPYSYRTGDSISSTYLGSPTYDYFYMDWYQIPAMLQKPHWSEPYFDEGAGNILMATYSVPFYCSRSGERRFAGIATIDLELEWLTDIVSQVTVFESGYAFVLSRNGVAITHPDKTMIMNKSIFSNAEEWNAPLLREIGRELMKGNSQFRKYDLPGRKEHWIYYRNLQSNKWSLCVVFPDEEMFASLNYAHKLLILFIILGLLLLSLLISGIVNRLASPLIKFAATARVIAQGNFNAKIPPVKTRDEMLELHNAFSHMQNQLAVYVENLKETTVAKEKIESELRIAREIQLSMIPHTFPPFPDLPQITLHASLKSAKEVGGDLYDFFVLDKSKFCFAIGDVSGKGVPASLFMAVTRTLLRSISDKEKTASVIMENLNKSLAYNNESNMFVTFFLGILDLNTGILQYANAGHNPPVIINKDGKVVMFETAKAIPLGLFENFNYARSEMQLSFGDMIFAYTDGVTEAENEHSKLFGEELMLTTIDKLPIEAHPKDLITLMEKAIDAHVLGFPQSDDITMMTIKYNG